MIAVRLDQGLRLTGCSGLQPEGLETPCSTLNRFAVDEFGFGNASPTVPVVDGRPGEELQVDTGLFGW